MIGNDIVDLHFVDCPPYQHVGHPERVCTPEELRYVREAEKPSLTVAALWACKEAAYKLFSRQTCRPFVPKQFAVVLGNAVGLHATEAAIVIHGGTPVRAELSVTNDWLHATAISAAVQMVRWKVREIGRGPGRGSQPLDDSRSVRLLADELVSRYCEQDVLQSSQGRIPILKYKNGGEAATEVSFSHHGRFAAVAMAWPIGYYCKVRPPREIAGKIASREEACSICIA